uniref:Ligand-gated ion channel n=1 Tax=Dolomedes sulfureus TaxID=492288 RepID=A0A0P0DQG7_9ARAC|nr:ligand-gated ion channel [Dolomedes sulfureus]
MVTISSEVNSLTPPAPYTKASDVWIGFCESLVFAVFLEFIFVALIAGRDDESSNTKGEIIPSLDLEAKEHNLSSDSMKSPMSRLINMFDARNGGKGKTNASAYRIDRICRIVFPFIFVLFNVVYWSVYVSA